MTAFTIPTGWEHFDNAKDQVTFSRVGHSSALPNLCIIKRSTVAASATSPATSKYNLKFVLGVDQESGGTTSAVARPNALVDITVRHVDAPSTPLAQEDLELTEVLAEAGLLLADPTFVSNAINSLQIPTG